jgi:hypothetical protein
VGFGFSYSHRSKDIKNLYENLGRTGQGTFDAGNALIDSEVNTLQGYRGDYANRLKNPLGEGPNSATGIFTRARGALSDTATQRTGAFGARLTQLARQTGGNLSPAAIAQLQEQNSREVNQELFTGNTAISDAQASLTLSETSKLFDRMESISKTILGVGENKRNLGLSALIQSILGRADLKNANAANARAAVGTAISAGVATSGAGSSGGGANPYTGQH